MTVDRVLILDFGSQVTQLIARRVRESGVYCEIHPFTLDEARLRAFSPKAVILSGSPASVTDPGAPRAPAAVFALGVPVLGICYGQQTLCAQLGGRVEGSDHREFGRAWLEIREDCALFDGVWQTGGREQVWMSHGDRVTALPEGFRVVATSEGAPFAVIADEARRYYGVQFHPEVAHTSRGRDLLERFLYSVCGCPPLWTHTSIIESQVAAVRAQVGGSRVLCALSGGVDSAVAAALVHKAIGDQLTCVFVDTGLMRSGEGEQVEETFLRQFHVDLVHVKAADRFFTALAGVTEPEAKRKIIGELFIRVFEEVARDLVAGTAGGDGDAGGGDGGDGGDRGGDQAAIGYLVQGTLYPDVIESGTGDAAKIKSHHNVGGLPEDLAFDLVEPLRLLFKDEVRAVGEELGLPHDIVWRQPFPGPGLGVHIIGEVTPERAEILRAADAIVVEEVRRAGLYRELWQSFAVLPAVRTVGVMGDGRTYAYPIVIRAVTSDDAMTADWARLPYELLERLSSRIINEVEGVNRVALDITSKPPGTIEWE